MNTFVWEDGTLVERPYVEIDGVKYYVQDGNVSGGTPASANNLNEMQTIINNNIKTADVYGNNYVKMIDGTLICWGETSAFNISTSSQANNDITLPVAYKDSNFKVICSVRAGGAYWASIVAVMGYPLSNNSIRLLGANYMSGQTIENVKLSYITIGRWK